MSADRQRARRLFEGALELPVEDRPAFLDRHCAGDGALRREVESLMAAAGDMGSFMDEGRLGALAAETLGHAPDPLIGRSLGRYRILSEIARGGMGVVYKATQENPDREVALKVIAQGLLSPEAVRRFEVEVQVLGRLQHPAIGRIFEAGTAETEFGRWPFFAMEYIEGLPLTEWADSHALDLRRRLELMVAVCEGVHYAHQRGIIHRDLKPANILVDESGRPRILDFGVARSTDADIRLTSLESGSSGLLGTLPYMSPEQLRGAAADPDTRADVYALGVLCFEILSTHLPHDIKGRSLADSIRIIAEARPWTLAAVGCPAPADVETIVAKALAGDPDRRYDSAAALAADIQRFLDNRPILARRAGTLYQLRKLVARNRLAASLTAILVAIVMAGGALLAVQTQRIRIQRDRATAEAGTAREVSEFLQDLFSVSDPRVARGREMPARELLDRGAERIGTELAGQPLVQARLLILLGNIYRNLGYLEEAGPLLEQGIERARGLEEDEPALLVEGLQGLAWLHRSAGRVEEGAAVAREAIDYAQRVLGGEHPRLAELFSVQGVLLRDSGDFERARSALEQAVALGERAAGPGAGVVGTALYHLAWLEHLQRQDDQALALQQRACPILEQALGEDRTEVAWCYNDQSVVLWALGRRQEAADMLRQALAIWEKVLPPGHPDVATGIDNLASQLLLTGQAGAAEEQYRRALSMRERSLGPDHPDVGGSLCNLAYAKREIGQLARSEEHFRQGLAILEAALGTDDQRVVGNLNGLAELYMKWGRFEQALAVYERALAARGRSHGPDHPWYAGALSNRAGALSALARHREAEADRRRALEIAAAHAPPDNLHRTRFAVDLADTLIVQRRLAEAEVILEEVRSALEQADSPIEPLAQAWFSLARIARLRGDTAGARAAVAEALEVRKSLRTEQQPALRYTEATLMADDGDEQGALGALRDALAAGFPSHAVARGLDLSGLGDDAAVDALLAEFRPGGQGAPTP